MQEEELKATGENVRAQMVEDAVNWAVSHGIVMQSASSGFVHVPLTLTPSPITRGSFEAVRDAATLWNIAMDRVAMDADYLLDTMKDSAATDDFVGEQLAILRKLQDPEAAAFQASKRVLSLCRSDYMLQGTLEKSTFLQIEYNTISAAFGCLSSRVTDMHRFLLTKYRTAALDPANVPVNDAEAGLVEAFATAMGGSNGQVVMMITLPGERNSADQRWIEYGLYEKGISMIRRSFTDIAARASMDPDTKKLSIDGFTVGVCYYRAGYDPAHYSCKADWEAVLLMEQSQSIVCPSVAYHLAGSKKVQQRLSIPGELERFVSDAEATTLRSFCTGLWGLEESEEADAVVAQAIEHPHRFVLKPQREGGNNNVWGESIASELKRMSPKERAGYILMERIHPILSTNVLLRDGQATESATHNEIGIYSVFIRQKDEILSNKSIGHLLRTKVAGTDEGGVAAGYSCLDSPYLIH